MPTDPTHALIFANGDVNDGEMVRRALIEAGNGALLIAADGGARVARYFGLTVHAVIGDMDSIMAADLAALERAGAQVLRFPAEKDETDLELALIYAAEQGAQVIRIIGAVGDRLDQTFSNLYLLELPALAGRDVRVVAGRQEARLLPPGGGDIFGAPGDTVSLLPLNGTAHQVRTEGLQYPLRDEDLVFGPARGVSNVMLGAQARVTLDSGTLLVIHTVGAGLMDGRELRVFKRHADGSPAWSYPAIWVAEGPAHLCLSAFFDVNDRDDGYFVWQRGDRFVEWYYRDRWYNVFQIFDRASGALRGWYCNITRPAVWDATMVIWEDLELDVFVAPDGQALVLDREAFAALPLTDEERAQAEAAVVDILARATAGEAPFTQ